MLFNIQQWNATKQMKHQNKYLVAIKRAIKSSNIKVQVKFNGPVTNVKNMNINSRKILQSLMLTFKVGTFEYFLVII